MLVATIVLLLNGAGLDDHHGIRVVPRDEVPEPIHRHRFCREDSQLELTEVVSSLGPVQGDEVVWNLPCVLPVQTISVKQMH